VGQLAKWQNSCEECEGNTDHPAGESSSIDGIALLEQRCALVKGGGVCHLSIVYRVYEEFPTRFSFIIRSAKGKQEYMRLILGTCAHK